MGLPKCVATKFAVITREESFVHCCVGKVAVKVSVAIRVVSLKVLTKTSTLLPLVSHDMRIFLLNVVVVHSPILGKVPEMLEISWVVSVGAHILILVNSLCIFARSLSYT